MERSRARSRFAPDRIGLQEGDRVERPPMTYFPDSSEYEYAKGAARNSLHRNVGWLDREHSFPTGDVPHDLVEKLRACCAVLHNPMRGYHLCELCALPTRGVPEVCGGKLVKLGCAEIRVEGKAGVVYCAPNLILHYVTTHRYLPPAEFLEALGVP
jgi:hypothetical protein